MKLFTGLTFILLVNISIISAGSADYWIRVPTSINTGNTGLYHICFSDTLNGWAAGDSGIIIHTSDGGTSWIQQNSTINYLINDLFFINSRLGWAVANNYLYQGTMVLRTTDGGMIWSGNHFFDTTLVINSVCFTDSLTGFFGAFNGNLYKSTNAGISWSKCSVGFNNLSTLPIFKVRFYNSQYGLACGGVMDIAGLIWRTTDSGNNWSVVDTTPEPVHSAIFHNFPNCYASGGDVDFGGSYSVSSNAGSTWKDTLVGYAGIGQAISFRTSHEYWIPLGYTRSWVKGVDTTNSWELIPAPDTAAIYDVTFVDPTHGWACGYWGAVYMYNKLIGIENIQSKIPANFILYQNYPNPFNPITKINYQLPGTNFVSIRIFDILGREVNTLVNKKQNAGNYQVEWNGNNFASGVYFYQLICNGILIDTKKLVLMK